MSRDETSHALDRAMAAFPVVDDGTGLTSFPPPPSSNASSIGSPSSPVLSPAPESAGTSRQQQAWGRVRTESASTLDSVSASGLDGAAAAGGSGSGGGGSARLAGKQAGARERGIVTVVEHTARSKPLDDEGRRILEMLDKIPRFEPLLKASLVPDSAFNFSLMAGLFGGASSKRSSEGAAGDLSISHEPFEKIALAFKRHLQNAAQEVCADQKKIEDNVARLDLFSTMVANTIAQRHAQMRSAVDQLAQVSNLKSQTRKAAQLLDNIVVSLARLDHLLPPELRIDSSETATLFPTLSRHYQIRRRVSQPAPSQPPGQS
ncbi:hypothetical protein BC831DRAFT_443781 [Entophlyctis helioformis]|nr:hypothetical protein BC831DRAFT_443781 [Entophlyctis helioformis]